MKTVDCGSGIFLSPVWWCTRSFQSWRWSGWPGCNKHGIGTENGRDADYRELRVHTSGRGPVTGGKVTFTLSGFDLDGGVVMPGVVDGVISALGTGSVNLWPNVAGLS